MSICNNLFRLTQAWIAVKISSSTRKVSICQSSACSCSAKATRSSLRWAEHSTFELPGPGWNHKVNFLRNSYVFTNCCATWLKTLSVIVSMSVFSQMMSDNRRCFIWSNIAPVSGLITMTRICWNISHNGRTPYIRPSSVTIEEPISVHQGFELNRNWV